MGILNRSLMLMLVATSAAAAPNVATEEHEKLRRLGVVHDSQTRSYYCETPMRIGHDESATARSKIVAERPVSWSPIIPFEQLMGERSCWKNASAEPACTGQSPLDCCLSTDAEARALAADLQNWAPIEDAFAATRTGSRIVLDATQGKSLCGGMLDPTRNVYRPRAARRGDIARLLLYLESAYGVRLEPDVKAASLHWDVQDPPDDYESKRDAWLTLLQGEGLGIPANSIDDLIREQLKRAPGFRESAGRAEGELLEDLRADSPDYPQAFYSLEWLVRNRLGHLAPDALVNESEAWDQLFELLEAHHLAARAARAYYPFDYDTTGTKMFTLAVASGHAAAAHWYADWLRSLSSQLEPTAYFAFVLQLADIVVLGRWPNEDELRENLGPYRSLFVESSSQENWSVSLRTAGNAYLDQTGLNTPDPALLPAELVAVEVLRAKYLGASETKPSHPLQMLATWRVPAMRLARKTPTLDAVRKFLEEVPELPALHAAILAGSQTDVEQVLAAGADVDARDYLGATSLEIAIEWNRAGIVETLLAAGARPSPGNVDLFSVALAFKRTSTARRWLDSGLDFKNQSTETKLKILSAAVETAPELVPRLLQLGARPSDEASWRELVGDTIVHAAPAEVRKLLPVYMTFGLKLERSGVLCAMAWEEQRLRGHLEETLRLGADIDEVDEEGLRPIHCAIESGALMSVKLLVEAGADLEVTDTEGLSPAAYANDMGMRHIANYLKEQVIP